MQQRVFNKINYETNIVNPKTMFFLLKAVQKSEPLTYVEGRDFVFPIARNDAGMNWDVDKPDTHASNVLEQYGLVTPSSDRTIIVSSLGKRFLAAFNTNGDVIANENEYTFILLKMLCAWKVTKHDRSIHPGRIILKLLSEPELNFSITDNEFAYWTGNSELNYNDDQYQLIKQAILRFRSSGARVELKKADVFLRTFSGSWNIFDCKTPNGNNGLYLFWLKEKTKQILQANLQELFGEDEVVPTFQLSNDEEILPEEEAVLYGAGAVKKVAVNVYERNPKARKDCIDFYKSKGKLKCEICGFDFESVYGRFGVERIHIHHIVPLNEAASGSYKIDPTKDLLPVCANCHYIIHTKRPAFTIPEIKEMLFKTRRSS